MSNGFASLIDGIKQRDPAVCGDAPLWVLEIVLENLEAAKLKIDKGADARGVKREFYLGACRFVSDQCSDEADVLMNALAKSLNQ